MYSVLTEEAVTMLAARSASVSPGRRMSPRTVLVAQVSAMSAVARAIADHADLPAFLHVDVATELTGLSGTVRVSAQPAPGDVAAVAAWAAAYRTPFEVDRPEDRRELSWRRCATTITLPIPFSAVVTRLEVWTVAKGTEETADIDWLATAPQAVSA